MALGIDKEQFMRMVNYFRNNVGGALALYNPKPGELVKHPEGHLVKPIRATKDLDELNVMVYRYLEGYRYYTDYPLVEYNNEKTLLFILKSAKDEQATFKRNNTN